MVTKRVTDNKTDLCNLQMPFNCLNVNMPDINCVNLSKLICNYSLLTLDSLSMKAVLIFQTEPEQLVLLEALEETLWELKSLMPRYIKVSAEANLN